MKIIHTADWHIGKVLHKHPLSTEINLFFSWLLECIQKENADILLVSGDVFDVARPAVDDRKIYYDFLSELNKLDIKIIITGGNHDSIAFLEAPKYLLSSMNITVVGGAKEKIEEELILVEKGNEKVVIAAVPYLRDKDLRSKDQEVKTDRITQIRNGIKNHYKALSDLCKKNYAGIPVIAMGHLFAKGVVQSDSEREIQIGNEAAVESNCFTDHFGYSALGHIHRPQIVGKDEFIRYSGSPIALSFSEKKDIKSVVAIELINHQFQSPRVIEVPKFRELKRFSGSLDDIEDKLSRYSPQFKLLSFVELDIKEEINTAAIQMQKEDLISKFSDHEQFKILKSRIEFKQSALDTAQLFTSGENIEDLKPLDIFEKRLNIEEIDTEFKLELVSAFKEILNEVLEAD